MISKIYSQLHNLTCLQFETVKARNYSMLITSDITVNVNIRWSIILGVWLPLLKLVTLFSLKNCKQNFIEIALFHNLVSWKLSDICKHEIMRDWMHSSINMTFAKFSAFNILRQEKNVHMKHVDQWTFVELYDEECWSGKWQ